MSSKNFKYE